MSRTSPAPAMAGTQQPAYSVQQPQQPFNLDLPLQKIARSQIMRSRLARSTTRATLHSDHRSGRIQKPVSKTNSPQSRTPQKTMASANPLHSGRPLYDRSIFNQTRPNSWHFTSPSTAEEFLDWPAAWYIDPDQMYPQPEDWSFSTTRNSSIGHNELPSDVWNSFQLDPQGPATFSSSRGRPADSTWTFDPSLQSSGPPHAFPPALDAPFLSSDQANADVNLLEQCIMTSTWLDNNDLVDYRNIQMPDFTKTNPEVGPQLFEGQQHASVKPDLVGVGLYDDVAKKQGLLGSWSIAQPESPFGKGLKLEEMWQPPSQDVEESDDDDTGTEHSSLSKSPDSRFGDDDVANQPTQWEDFSIGVVDYESALPTELDYPIWQSYDQSKAMSAGHVGFHDSFQNPANQQYRNYRY